MKKSIIISLGLLITISSFAQVKEVLLSEKSTNLNVVLQNPNISPVPTFTWQEVGNSGFLSTDLSSLTTGSVKIDFKASVVVGNEATLSVVAKSGDCPSDAKQIKLRVVNTASYSVVSGTATGSVCQGSVASINLTFNTSIVKFSYFIDTDKDGKLSGSEIVESATVNNSTFTLATSNLSVIGTYPLIVTSVIGNDGTNAISSPSNYAVSLTVNEKPVIKDIF